MGRDWGLCIFSFCFSVSAFFEGQGVSCCLAGGEGGKISRELSFPFSESQILAKSRFGHQHPVCAIEKALFRTEELPWAKKTPEVLCRALLFSSGSLLVG